MKTNLSRRDIRLIWIQQFHLKSKAIEATNNICSTMGEDLFSIRTAQHWFNRFNDGNLEIDDLFRSGRSSELDVELIKQIIEEDPRLTSQYLEGQFGCFHTTVEKHQNDLGKTRRYEVWIPNELSTHQLKYKVDVWLDLMTFHRNYQWLHNLITGNEKCLLDINYKHRRQWVSAGERGTATPKSDRHTNESDAECLMKSQSDYSLGNFFKWFCTMTADLSCQQVDRVTEKLKKKQNRIYSLHDNARPHYGEHLVLRIALTLFLQFLIVCSSIKWMVD